MTSAYSDVFSPDEIDPRVTVHEGRQTVEIDLSGLYFHTSKDVNAFFDQIEERLQETGEPLWFFLDNVTDFVEPESVFRRPEEHFLVVG